MRSHSGITALAVALGLTLSACDGVTVEECVDAPEGTVCVHEHLDADTTWTSDNTYFLAGQIRVDSGTLTIEAGTKIVGGVASTLIVTKDGRVDAEGTASEPIVFTSEKAAGSRSRGDWGGVVLLGSAPINTLSGESVIEGFPASLTGIGYGGSDATHDCGTLKYVRIEFAGFEFSPDNELNGLTVGGCGSQTVLDYIQVHKGEDDGVEFFGGTADFKHVLVTQTDDDSIDWDLGWQGRGQFLIVQQAASAGNMAFESDSNKDAPDTSPRSQPEIWNATLIGSNAEPGAAYKTQKAMHLRRGTGARLSNFIVAHFADGAIDVDGDHSVTQADEDNLYLTHSILFDNANLDDTFPPETGDADNDSGFDEAAFFFDPSFDNLAVDPELGDALNLTSPSFAPLPGSPALTQGATPPGDGFFDATATFAGAIGEADWTAGWTAYPEN